MKFGYKLVLVDDYMNGKYPAGTVGICTQRYYDSDDDFIRLDSMEDVAFSHRFRLYVRAGQSVLLSTGEILKAKVNGAFRYIDFGLDTCTKVPFFTILPSKKKPPCAKRRMYWEKGGYIGASDSVTGHDAYKLAEFRRIPRTAYRACLRAGNYTSEINAPYKVADYSTASSYAH